MLNCLKKEVFMNKIQEVQNSLFDVLKRGFEVTLDDINSNKEDYLDCRKQINTSVTILLKEIQEGNIKHFSYDGTANKTQEQIVVQFPYGLFDLHKMDFEGKEPLSIDDMLQTASFYIFEAIKRNEVSGVSFHL